MKKNTSLQKMLGLLLIYISMVYVANAQPPLQDPPPPPPPGNGITPPPPPHAQRMQRPPLEPGLQQVTTYKGTVTGLLSNDDFVYDGLSIRAGNDTLGVKFPPHLGLQITGAVKQGTAITVSGVMNTTPMGEKELRMITITAGAETITDTGLSMPVIIEPQYVSGSGKITKLQTNREGMVNGFIVDGKTILRIPPHIAGQLNGMADVNAAIAYTGMKKNKNTGESMTQDYTVIHCKTITLNGQQYVVQ